MASKNKVKAGMKLHKVIALGKKPADFKKINKKK
jgi:hypothetical protein